MSFVTGITPSHAAAGQSRQVPAHLVMCMLVLGRRMIRLLARDLMIDEGRVADKVSALNISTKFRCFPFQTSTLPDSVFGRAADT